MKVRRDIHQIPSVVASCRCDTKTQEPEWHHPLCPYRLIRQIELIQDKAKEISLCAQTGGPIHTLALEILEFKAL